MQIAESQKLRPGIIVADRYQVLTLLGEGGMGQVALVRQSVTQKLGAMKLLTTILPEILERFNREAAAPSRLNHPAFPAVFDFGHHEGLPYIVMDFVDGDTITAATHDGHRFSLAEIVEIGRQICDAMATAHAAGLVHRDIKSDNIMLVASRGGAALRAFVLDLGIARFSANAGGDMRTKAGVMLGTPVTMSPEQACGNAIDGRSDVYSLGCVLFYLATGGYPFVAEDPLQIAMRHIVEPPPRADDLAPWLPAPFAHVIDRTLRKDPADRYQSMTELDAALAAFVGSPSAPPEFSTPLQTRPRARAVSESMPIAVPSKTPRTPLSGPTLSPSDAPTQTPVRTHTPGSLTGSNGEVVPAARRRSAWSSIAVGVLVVGLGGGAWVVLQSGERIAPPIPTIATPFAPSAPSVPPPDAPNDGGVHGAVGARLDASDTPIVEERALTPTPTPTIKRAKPARREKRTTKPAAIAPTDLPDSL